MKPAAALTDAIHAALPQTQCTRCGYADCRGYAQAIAEGTAGIDRCPPGGRQGVERLARLSGQPARALDPRHGHEGPRRLAVIDETWCIGCTLCLDACPVDAIVGASKVMHTVIESHCTGCELCIPVCPVDCIALTDVTGQRTGWDAWSAQQADEARERYALRTRRIERDRQDREQRLAAGAAASTQDQTPPGRDAPSPAEGDPKRRAIELALARARARQSA